MKQQTSAATETKIKGRNIIDFTGKTIYVGKDVHEKDYQVAKVFEVFVWASSNGCQPSNAH